MKVFTLKEVAEFLRISTASVRRAAARGDIVALNIPGRLLFTSKSIEEFLHGARPTVAVGGDRRRSRRRP